MSDREGTPESRESGAVSPSRSRSFSASPSRQSVKSEEGSVHSAPENGEEKSPQGSRSRSRSPRARSYSRSRSRSYERKFRSRSRSRSRDRKRYRSRSRRSRSRSRRRYSRSRSRSPYRRRSRHSRSRGERYHRSHSRSPMSRRRRHLGSRDNPRQSRCLGVFGLSLYTEERDIREVFERYGPIDEVQVVYDHQTGRSRGFSFVYFRNTEDAAMAKERCTGIEIDGRRIRVDYSITERAHTPTPGIYLGKSTGGSRPTHSSPIRRSEKDDRRHTWRRSPSPYYRRGGRYSRSRSRSRSYSPRLEERIKENET